MFKQSVGWKTSAAVSQYVLNSDQKPIFYVHIWYKNIKLLAKDTGIKPPGLYGFLTANKDWVTLNFAV